MKLFTIGPVAMYDETLKIGGEQLPYFRTSEFSQIVYDAEKHLKRLMNAPGSSRVIFLTSSGTGAMEASVINLFDGTDKLIIINGGSFGNRFCEICDIHGIDYTAIAIEELTTFNGKGYSGLLVNMHETGTGELYPMESISAFCKANNMLLVVDAISSFLADEFDFEKLGVDVAITSSQKAMALECGLSPVVLSEKAIEKLKNPKSLYFNFLNYLQDAKRGQTPFTPNVGAILQMKERLSAIENVQIEVDNRQELAKHFRSLVKAKIPSYPLSNALTPILVSDAQSLFELLKSSGFMVAPCGGDMADKMLRIGHLGNINKQDLEELARVINEHI